MTDGAPSAASDENPPPFATLAAATAVENQINDGLPAHDYKLLTTGATGLAERQRRHARAQRNQAAERPLPAQQGHCRTTATPPARCIASTRCGRKPAARVSHSHRRQPVGLHQLAVPLGGNHHRRRQQRQSAARRTSPTSRPVKALRRWASITWRRATSWFKHLADTYTISDNFHQSIMGGTGANHIAVGTGLAIYYTDGQGNIATPPANEIENPNPQPGTNNYYAQDGYSGGSYSNCSDTEPAWRRRGRRPISPACRTARPCKCQAGAYYLLNNYNPGYYGDGTVNTSTFTIPPSLGAHHRRHAEQRPHLLEILRRRLGQLCQGSRTANWGRSIATSAIRSCMKPRS